MTSALGGVVGSPKADNSTDRLRDRDSDREEEVYKPEIFADVTCEQSFKIFNARLDKQRHMDSVSVHGGGAMLDSEVIARTNVQDLCWSDTLKSLQFRI